MSSPNIDLNTLLSLLKVFKKLSFFKNNLALLVPIIIAVVAILLFIPTTLLSNRLRATITTQSVKPGQAIDGLMKQVDEAAQAEAMDPYIKAYGQDANAIDNLILQSSQRELLSYRLFPPEDPCETSPLLFEPFRQAYLAGVDAMLKNLNAGAPPSDAEIYAALDASATRAGFRRNRPATTTGRTQRINVRMLPEAERRIVAKVCEDKARGAKVYASPVDLGGYVFWTDWKFENWDKAVKDCWYWQTAYWALEDVATTISQMNKDSDSVIQAPVKRIMNVLFTQSRTGARTTIGTRGRRGAPKDKQTPTYAANAKTSMTGTPCTGRFCNDTLFVMQFDVRVIVRTAEVMHVMQELCSAKPHKWRGWRGDQPAQNFKHNQIAILECEILPIDREDFDHNSYEYGPDEVVSADLICEYVVNQAAFELKGSLTAETGKAPATGAGKAPQAGTANVPQAEKENLTVVPEVVFKDITDAQTAKKR